MRFEDRQRRVAAFLADPVRAAAIALVTGAAGFMILAAVVVAMGIGFDESVGRWLHRLAGADLDNWWADVSKLGSVEALSVLAGLTVLLLLRAGRRQEAVLVAAALPGAVLVGFASKLCFRRLSPVHGWPAGSLTLSPRDAAALGLLVCVVAGLTVYTVMIGALARRVSRPPMGAALPLVILTAPVVESAVRAGVHHAGADAAASFPSAHTLNCASVGLAIAVATWRTRWRIPATLACAVSIALVGLSRILLAVHHPTDVVGGFFLAVAWIATLVLVAHASTARGHPRSACVEAGAPQ